MSTFRIPILGPNTLPDASGKVWPEPYSILATNDVWRHTIFRYDEDINNNLALTTRVGLYGTFIIPKNYVGSAKIIPVWTSTIITGNVVWDLDYRQVGGDDAESLDQAGTQETLTLTDAAPTAANRLLIPGGFSLTLTGSPVDDMIEFFLANDGTDGADTLAGGRLLINALFEYADV